MESLKLSSKGAKKRLKTIKSLRKTIRSLRDFEKLRIILSPNPPELIENSFNYKQHPEDRLRLKPKGLYYSLGDHWANFVENEFTTIANKYNFAYTIKVNKEKLVTLSNPKEIYSFHKKYAQAGVLAKEISSGDRKTDFWDINWNKVAKDFSGIELQPYLNQCRHLLWYSTWDVPSGCLWNSKALKEIQLIEPNYNIK